jgi:hypothetical protein
VRRTAAQVGYERGPAPKPEVLKAILDKPDGEKQLDEIIKTLDPKAKRKACQLALEIRFNIKLSCSQQKKVATEEEIATPDTGKNKKARLYCGSTRS